MKKAVFLVGVAVMFAFLTTSVFAAEVHQVKAERARAARSKLNRGAHNAVFGWSEIPKSVVCTTRCSNAFKGVTIGTVKGVFNAVARTVSGIVDVATFPVGRNQRPAIQPSMVKNTCCNAGCATCRK
ncbi:MAG: exosortase system-associated protein, TIGR04073 family [Candidatus Omnitrophota bacterium]